MPTWRAKVTLKALATESVLVCLPTTTLRDAPLYRLSATPGDGTGLHLPSQVMVDKIMAVRRDRCVWIGVE